MMAIPPLIIGLSQLRERHEVTATPSTPPVVQEVVVSDVAEPAETKPVEDEYVVPADQPRRLMLPTISTVGLVQKVGLNQQGAISVPNNINFVGLYTGGVLPGDPGLSIIDGHVTGRYNDGVFRDLAKLKPGDVFDVEYGDRSTRSFTVVDLKMLPEAETSAYMLNKRDDIAKQLNLITCGGKFDKDSQTYDQRLVVVSKAIE